MEINELSKKLIVIGYQSFRSIIHEMVKMRLEGNLVDIYGDYYSSCPEDVKACAAKMEVDFHASVDINADKAAVALKMLETDIKTMLLQKKEYDAEMKSLGIVLKPEEIRITNGIEICEWFEFFGSPMGHNWFSQNANKILAACDSDDPGYPKLEKMVSNIRANWNKIEPQQPLPDINAYRHLTNMQVPDVVKDLVSKHSDD